MRLLSGPRPEYVDRCLTCGSAFFNFGDGRAVSHNDQYQDDLAYQRYLLGINTASVAERNREALDRLKELLYGAEEPRLFDVGAGSGDFLALARSKGFVVGGNEISPPAIEACRHRHGIDLAMGDDLGVLAANSPKYDAVTMWCIIAHVDDPQHLLSGVRMLLRSGGFLFFSTPRYCLIDYFSLLLMRLTGNRLRSVFDRRINQAHRRQYSVQGIEALLGRGGFIPLSVAPSIGYGLHMERYLSAVGVPRFIAAPVGRGLEYLAKSGLTPRNVLNVYAQAT